MRVRFPISNCCIRLGLVRLGHVSERELNWMESFSDILK